MRRNVFTATLVLILTTLIFAGAFSSSAKAQNFLSCNSENNRSGAVDTTLNDQDSSTSVSFVAAQGDSSTTKSNIAINAAWSTPLWEIDCAGDNFITSLKVDLKTAIGSSSLLEGSSITFSGDHRRFSTTLPPGGRVPVPDKSKIQHAFVLAGGLQADASFENFAILTEAGYSPLYEGLSGFTLGPPVNNEPWIDVGVFLQAGYYIATRPTSETNPSPSADEVLNSSGALVRFKLFGLGNILLPVKLPNTIGFRIVPEAWLWYDVLDNQAYGLLKGRLSLDVDSGFSFDIVRFTRGNSPLNYAPESRFGTGITIRF